MEQLTDAQIKELEKKLSPDSIKTRKQGGKELSYIEGWRTIDEANRIFGFGNWTRETVELIENCSPTKNRNDNSVVSFRAKVRVTACGIVREGVGFGSGISFDIHDAYEGAIKEAETDAMKRALMTFGNPFGLALYDKKKENVEECTRTRLGKIITKINEAKTYEALSAISKEQETIDVLKLTSREQTDYYNDKFNAKGSELNKAVAAE